VVLRPPGRNRGRSFDGSPCACARSATVHLLLAAGPGAPAATSVRCRHYSPASARVFAANVQPAAIKLSALTVQ
jgi:hypothetical protein